MPSAVTAAHASSTWVALEHAGIRTWVIGGWGIDALVGRATRDHHDLDVFVLHDGVARLLDLVRSSGTDIHYLWEENRWVDERPTAFVTDLAGVELDVHTIATTDGGIDLLSEHAIELPPDALDAVGTIAGVRVRCATAAAQRIMHTGYELPEHHVRDLEALDRLGLSD